MKKVALLASLVLASCQTTQEPEEAAELPKPEKKYHDVVGQLNPTLDCLFLCVSYCTPKEDKVEYPTCEPLSLKADRESGTFKCECQDKGFNIQYMGGTQG